MTEKKAEGTLPNSSRTSFLQWGEVKGGQLGLEGEEGFES